VAPSIRKSLHYHRRLVEVEVEVNLRQTVSRPVCLVIRRPSGTRDQFFFPLEISFRQLRVCYFVAPSLTRGRVCNLLYNCFWALPEQSLLGRSPAEPTAICYCLILDSPTWRARFPYLYPSGTGWPSYTPAYWVPFMSPLTTRRAAVELFSSPINGGRSVGIVRSRTQVTEYFYCLCYLVLIVDNSDPY
jgi:hypothetical protein